MLDQFYGPGNSHKTFVTWLVRQCLNNDLVPLTVGTQKRRFLYIDDLVSGYMAAIQGALWQTASFLEFHLASREQFSIREVAEMVRSLDRLAGRAPLWRRTIACSRAEGKLHGSDHHPGSELAGAGFTGRGTDNGDSL